MADLVNLDEYYRDILGVWIGASHHQIKRAYLQLEQFYRPDCSEDRFARVKCEEVHDAYLYLMARAPVRPDPLEEELLAASAKAESPAAATTKEKAPAASTAKSKPAAPNAPAPGSGFQRNTGIGIILLFLFRLFTEPNHPTSSTQSHAAPGSFRSDPGNSSPPAPMPEDQVTFYGMIFPDRLSCEAYTLPKSQMAEFMSHTIAVKDSLCEGKGRAVNVGLDGDKLRPLEEDPTLGPTSSSDQRATGTIIFTRTLEECLCRQKHAWRTLAFSTLYPQAARSPAGVKKKSRRAHEEAPSRPELMSPEAERANYFKFKCLVRYGQEMTFEQAKEKCAELLSKTQGFGP